MSNKSATESVSVQRSLLLEILAVAFLIAFGVHLLGSEAFDRFKDHTWVVLSVGCICEASAFLYLARKALLRLNTRSEYVGVFLAGKDNKAIVIPRYEFSEDFARYTQSLCTENPAIAKLWQTPLSQWAARNAGINEEHDCPSKGLVIEAVEYFLLDQLSLHLSGHFNNNENTSSEELISLSASDIPGVLLKNRFLSTFSRSMEERVAFMNAGAHPPDGRVVFAIGGNGEIYDAFELILPRGTKVERMGSGSLHITTNRFTLSAEVDFGGFSSYIDNEMASDYVKQEPFSFDSYKVVLKLSIKLNARSMLSHKGWEYYRWRETFIEQLEKNFSFARFKEEIGWETARTVAILRSSPRKAATNCNETASDATKVRVSIVETSLDIERQSDR